MYVPYSAAYPATRAVFEVGCSHQLAGIGATSPDPALALVHRLAAAPCFVLLGVGGLIIEHFDCILESIANSLFVVQLSLTSLQTLCQSVFIVPQLAQLLL